MEQTLGIIKGAKCVAIVTVSEERHTLEVAEWVKVSEHRNTFKTPETLEKYLDWLFGKYEMVSLDTFQQDDGAVKRPYRLDYKMGSTKYDTRYWVCSESHLTDTITATILPGMSIVVHSLDNKSALTFNCSEWSSMPR